MYEESVRRAVGSLRLGSPMREGGLCVVPLHYTAEVGARYVLLEQAVERRTLTITEVSEAGSVPFLNAVNKGPWPVLIFDGEELVGAKQNRIANATILVGVGKSVLPVSCVEQGRWSHRSQTFAAGQYTSHPSLRRQKEFQVRAQLREEVRDDSIPLMQIESGVLPQFERARRYRSDQGAVWDEVVRTTRSRGVHSPTMALADTYAAGKDDLDRILRALALPGTPGADSIVGVVVFVGGRFVCLDLLQPAKRFLHLYPKLLRGYALEAQLHADRIAKDFDAEAATLRLLAEMLEGQQAEQPGADLGTDVRLDAKRISAAGLVWQDELIQLSAFPKQEDDWLLY